MAEITWLGRACFRIRGREAVVLTDPIGPEAVVEEGQRAADIVTVSRELHDGESLTGVGPSTRIVAGPGEYEIADVFITGIRAHRTAGAGERRGATTIYLIEIEDLVICHLGNLGQTLTEEQAGGMSAVDVLFVPVGGAGTIDAAAAVEVIGQIEPAIVIPMPEINERGNGDREPLDRFLKQVGSVEVTPVPRLSIKKADLGESMQVVVLRR